MKPLITTLFILLSLSASILSAQESIQDSVITPKREPMGKKYRHLIGVKAAYNISGMDFANVTDLENIKTYENFQVSYTHYHPFWGGDGFGIQVSLSKLKAGYTKQNKGSVTFDIYSLPFISQFHIDFWRMRLLVNAGGFVGYRSNKVSLDGTKEFKKDDRKFDFGFIAGGGLAFIFKPFEIHAEANYQYSLSFLYKPLGTSADSDIFNPNYDPDNPYHRHNYTYPRQLLISLGIHFHL
jgi:hypothetical protein